MFDSLCNCMHFSQIVLCIARATPSRLLDAACARELLPGWQCIFIPFNVDLNVVLVMISNIQSCSSSATLHVSDRLSGLKSEFCSQKYEVSKANTISRLGNGSRLRLMFELWLFANGEHPMEALRRFSLLFPVSRICHIQRKFMKKNAMFWLHSDRTRRLVFASNFERWS